MNDAPLKKELRSGSLSVKFGLAIILISGLFSITGIFPTIKLAHSDFGGKELDHSVCCPGSFSLNDSCPDLPFLPEALEMEEYETADDEDSSRESLVLGFAHQSGCRETFDRNIRARYLHQHASVLSHPHIPLFILHHSWRAFPV